MVVALRKNLVLTDSVDTFVTDFSANFEYQYNYINNLYPDTSATLKLYDILKSFASYVTLIATGLPSGASIEWFLPDTDFLRFNSNNANIVERCTYTTLDNGITVSATSTYGRASFYFPVIKGNKYTLDFDSEVNGGYKMVYFSDKLYAQGEGWDPTYGNMQVGGHKSYTFTATSDILWIGIYASAATTDGTITLTNIKLIKNEATKVDVVKGSLIPYAVTFADTSKYISSVRANNDTIVDCSDMTSNTVTLTVTSTPVDATINLGVEGGNPFNFQPIDTSHEETEEISLTCQASSTNQTFAGPSNSSWVIREYKAPRDGYITKMYVKLSSTSYNPFKFSIASIAVTPDDPSSESQAGTWVCHDKQLDLSFPVASSTGIYEYTFSTPLYIEKDDYIVIGASGSASDAVFKASYSSGTKVSALSRINNIFTSNDSSGTFAGFVDNYYYNGITFEEEAEVTHSRKSITVRPGTKVRYTVSKTDYITQSNVIEVNETQSLNIVLSETLYTYIIHPTPIDATVTLTSPGYTQLDNSILVPKGTTVDWSVMKIDSTINERDVYSKTTSASDSLLNPSNIFWIDKKDIITEDGYIKSIKIPKNTSESNITAAIAAFTVTGESGYDTATITRIKKFVLPTGATAYNFPTSELFEVHAGETVAALIPGQMYWSSNGYFDNTINGGSIDSKVGDVLSGHYSGRCQIDNVFTECDVTYSYVSQSGTKVVNDNCADNITLKALVEFTVTPTPSDATVTLIATGYTQVGNSIKVPYGTTVMWMVEKEGYTTRSGSKIMTEDTEAQIILSEMLTLTIVPSPSDAVVHMECPGYIQQGNSITVPYGKTVEWEVSKEGMGTRQGRKVVTETESMEVVLLRYVTFTVTPTPSNATVELTAAGYTQEGNSITVLSTTRVHWKVYKAGYLPKSDYVVVNNDTTLPVTLTQAATLTINPTPADAIVTLTAEGYGQYGNKITVPLNTRVYWSVVKTGYVSQYDSEVMTADKTKNITLISN